MKQAVVSVVFVSIVLLAVSRNACARKRFSPDDYLQLFDMRNEFYRNVRSAMLELDVTDDSTTDEILQELKRATRETKDDFHRELYSGLARYAHKRDQCSSLLSLFTTTIYAQMRTDLNKFSEFVYELGGEKFASCARTEEAAFLKLAESRFEHKFDEFLGQALGLDAEAEDARRLAKLERFNPRRDKLDVHKMAEVAKKYAREEKKYSAPASLIANFFNIECGRVPKYLVRILDIINLAATFGTYETKQVRLRKVNEYRRICLTWSHDENVVGESRSTLMDNIVRQLK